ncbi:unnamed protein product [Allacma fusca]|uniref:Uncharacterized protein n=1 Tax=Allacma fusca TaxID=39272 RepID=A0A8J2NSF0_9HEXA|nr:unnamed protein product [Allacma fusca]
MTFKIIWICLYTVAIVGAYQYSMPYPFTSSSLKRSATVLNKLILQSFRNREEPIDAFRKVQASPDPDGTLSGVDELPVPQQDYTYNLQRRGPNADTRTYSRCYFNVVSCFK